MATDVDDDDNDDEDTLLDSSSWLRELLTQLLAYSSCYTGLQFGKRRGDLTNLVALVTGTKNERWSWRWAKHRGRRCCRRWRRDLLEECPFPAYIPLGILAGTAMLQVTASPRPPWRLGQKHTQRSCRPPILPLLQRRSRLGPRSGDRRSAPCLLLPLGRAAVPVHRRRPGRRRPSCPNGERSHRRLPRD